MRRGRCSRLLSGALCGHGVAIVLGLQLLLLWGRRGDAFVRPTGLHGLTHARRTPEAPATLSWPSAAGVACRATRGGLEPDSSLQEATEQQQEAAGLPPLPAAEEAGAAPSVLASDAEQAVAARSPPRPHVKREVTRREAAAGLLGGSLGIYGIVKSAQDMAARQAKDPATRTFVWNDNVGDMLKDADELFRAEEVYPLPFITYLSRFLLNFDPRCRTWWLNDVEAAVPESYSREQRRRLLFRHLAEFSTSVEYGLRSYMQAGGATAFCTLLKTRYEGKDGVEGRREREQLAVLFSLLDPAHQPVSLIDDLIASLPGASGTSRIFTIQQLDSDATRVVVEQTLRGMAQNPLMLLPARHMLPSPQPLPPSERPPDLPTRSFYYRVPGLETLGQRKRLIVDVEVDPSSLFGSRADMPVMKERSLGPATYLLFALSGAVGCAMTHSVVIPIDVVKTRAQVGSDGSVGLGLLEGAKRVAQTEGLGGLMRGWEPTLLGYLYYGVTVYPGYEFFKRALFSAVGPAGELLYHAPLVILAGALATIIACLGVCPAEAVRIRMVARQEPFTATLTRVAEEDGLSSLYDGFPPLLVRQVLFGMAKFLVFDSFGAAVLAAFPVLNEQVATQLAVSLVSGAVAGVVSAVVSQPADTVLSKMNSNQEEEGPSLISTVSWIWRERGLGGFYLGIGSRCLWSGSIISGQFLLYDVFKNLLHVAPADLGTFMDVIPSIQ